MKKTIIVEVLLAFILAVLLTGAIMGFQYTSKMIEICSVFDKDLSLYNELMAYYNGNISIVLSCSIPALLAAIATLTAMIIIAIKGLPCLKPLADKLNAKRAARKEQRAEQAAIAKQDRIAKLEAELDELKKDE